MKKQYLAAAKRTGKVVVCAALIAAMVVPTGLSDLLAPTADDDANVIEAEAADDVPEPILSIDFESGFIGEADNSELQVKQSSEVLHFAEITDVDADGNYTYTLDYETPFIEGSAYKYGVTGNQPTTYYDEDFGNTLMLDDSQDIEEYVKRNSDALDDEYPIGTVLQEETTAYSAASIKNPYAGMDFSEEPTITEDGATWTKGISISYWVKAGVKEQSESDIANYLWKNDSILFTFQNDSEEEVYQVDDLMKHEACLAYDACITGGAGTYTGEYSSYEYTADDFDLGTVTTVTDAKDSTKTYQVLSGYGKLIRFNPNYQGTTANKYYYTDSTKTSGEDAKYTDENGNTVLLFEIGQNYYKQYSTFDIESGSLIKRGKINGSLTIATSNSFAFKEDDYRTESTTNADGVVISTPIEGATQDNPNADKYGQITQFRHYNALFFQGDGTACEENDEGETEWHYVTCVIQNDWVEFYVDGELYNPDTTDWYYSPSNNLGFSAQDASKYFNLGYGLRAPYNKVENVDDWSADGEANESPANSVARTMLDWISDPETTLTIGGQGSANLGLEAQDIGNADGTLLDDIEFYDVPLTEDQAVALYEEAVEEKEAESTSTLLKKYTFDDDALYASPSGMDQVASNKTDLSEKNAVATVNGQLKLDTNPMVVNDAERGHVLATFGNTASYTSSVSFTNPFAGMDESDLTGATVSYWYKTVAQKSGVANSIGISFNDEPKIIEHGKIQESSADSETRTGLWTTTSLDTTFEAGYDTKVYESLKDKFITTTRYGVFTDPTSDGYMPEAAEAQTEWTNRTNSFTEWHFVTMVVNNAGITMYYDGEKLDNNIIDEYKLPAYYGPRFYDGYYQRVYDGFSAYKLASNNQGAPTLMGFLTQEDTKGYVGLAYVYGSNKTYQSTKSGLYDDIAYYAGAMTDEQVKALYEEAKAEDVSAVSGEDVWSFDGATAATEEPSATDEPENPDNNVKDTTGATTDASGNLVFNSTATGVKVTAPAGSISEDAQLVVTILGESESADRYTNADSVLAGISGLSVGSRILYDIHFEVNGETVQPTSAVTVELTPYTGYTASKCTVVYIDGKAIVATTTSGGNLVFSTQSLGEFALVQEPSSSTSGTSSTVSGSTSTGSKSSTSGSSTASKTGDVANVLLPLLLLAAAAAAIVIARKRKITE